MTWVGSDFFCTPPLEFECANQSPTPNACPAIVGWRSISVPLFLASLHQWVHVFKIKTKLIFFFRSSSSLFLWILYSLWKMFLTTLIDKPSGSATDWFLSTSLPEVPYSNRVSHVPAGMKCVRGNCEFQVQLMDQLSLPLLLLLQDDVPKSHLLYRLCCASSQSPCLGTLHKHMRPLLTGGESMSNKSSKFHEPTTQAINCFLCCKRGFHHLFFQCCNPCRLWTQGYPRPHQCYHIWRPNCLNGFPNLQRIYRDPPTAPGLSPNHFPAFSFYHPNFSQLWNFPQKYVTTTMQMKGNTHAEIQGNLLVWISSMLHCWAIAPLDSRTSVIPITNPIRKIALEIFLSCCALINRSFTSENLFSPTSAK